MIGKTEMKSGSTLAAASGFSSVLCEVVLDIDAFTQHMWNTMASMMRRQVIVLIQEGTSTHSWCYSTLCGMVKADEFSLHHPPVHHLVEQVRPGEVGKK